MNKKFEKPAQGKLFAGQRGFDPITIILQIFALQFTYYAGLTFWVIIVDYLNGLRPHTAQIYSSFMFNDLDAKYAKSSLVAQWLNVPFLIISQSLIVEKANKCLDFTVTLVFIRIFVMWISWEWPCQISFWTHETLWATITCLLAEALCMKMESKEIPLQINELLAQTASKAKQVVKQIKKSGKPKLKTQKVEPPICADNSDVVDNSKEVYNRLKKDEHV